MKQLCTGTLDSLSKLDNLVVKITPRALSAVKMSHEGVKPYQISWSLARLQNCIADVRSDVILYCISNDVLTPDELNAYVDGIIQPEDESTKYLSNHEVQEFVQLIDTYNDVVNQMDAANIVRTLKLVNSTTRPQQFGHEISTTTNYLNMLKDEFVVAKEPVKIIKN